MLRETANQDLICCVTCVAIIQSCLHEGKGMGVSTLVIELRWKEVSCMVPAGSL